MSIAGELINRRLLAMYSTAPRKIRFSLFASFSPPPEIGQILSLRTREITDAEGSPKPIQILVTAVKKCPDRYDVVAEEYLYTSSIEEDAEFGRIVQITADVLQDPMQETGGINARTIHDRNHPPPTSSTVVTVIVYEDVKVGSTTPTRRALDMGQWPAGCTVNLVIRASSNPEAGVRGAGGRGNGGQFGPSVFDGEAGGVAIYTRFPIHAWNYGTIAGGGGGGGRGGTSPAPPILVSGGFGGGGAGYVPGTAVEGGGTIHAQSGTLTSGGEPGHAFDVYGGRGGDPGQPGESGDNGSLGPGGIGGAAGAAVDGESFVTWEEEGTIIGPRVN